MHNEHHRKLKIYAFIVAFVLLVGAIYYASYKISSTTSNLAQCRDFFDNKDLENKKRLCCETTHYNSTDSLCSNKCDTIGINPESSFCTEVALKQEQPGLSIQQVKPKEPKLPECKNFVVESQTEKNGDQYLLKAGQSLKINYNIYSPETKAKSYVYEFFSYEDGKNNYRAISFEPGKSYRAFYNASDLGRVNQTNQIDGLHEDLYKQDLNNGSKYPKNILMVLSIVDQNQKKLLQGWNCYVKIKLDDTPNYCKGISISDKEISKGEIATITVTPNTPEVGNYDFRLINTQNNKEISFNSQVISGFPAVNTGNSRVIVNGNGNNPAKVNLSWVNLNKVDGNTNENLKNLKVTAYVRPRENVASDKVAACSVELKIKPDEGVKLCDNIKFTLYRKTGTVYNEVTSGSNDTYTVKSTDYISIRSQAKRKDIREFIYSFHNLDNLNNKDYGKGKGYTKEGIKNPYPINFKKDVDLEITKYGQEDSSDASIKVYYEDLDSIDLLTGTRPRSVQVRAFFKNSNNELSQIDSNCVKEFRIE